MDRPVLTLLCVLSLVGAALHAQDPLPRKLLFFTRNVGYYHDVVKRKGEQLSHAERALTRMGRRLGIEVECSKDGRIFDRSLDEYGIIAFFTNNDLTKPNDAKEPPMSLRGKRRFLEAIRNGKGFMSFHSGCACWRTPGEKFANEKRVDPYIEMIGGEFIQHGPQQKATIRVSSPHFPGLAPLGASFVMHEEWYATKNYNRDIHVLLAQETKGMKGVCYDRPTFPSTWVRRHGKGRVFTTTLAHRPDTWDSPVFGTLVMGGMRWLIGDEAAKTPPNLKRVTPQADVLRRPKHPVFKGLSFVAENAQGHLEYRVDRDPSVVMIRIPKGRIRRGSNPAPAKRGRLIGEYFIAKTETTNAHFLRAARSSGWLLPDDPDFDQPNYLKSKPDHPIVNVDWKTARAYCQWLAGAEPSLRGDLPTEAQWEYAARGPDGLRHPWGDEAPSPSHARFGGGWTAGPLRAGSLKAGSGPFGTLDQAGNVWEWCRDFAGPYPLVAPGDRNGSELQPRIVRGGAYSENAETLRGGARYQWPPETKLRNLGFRPVIEVRRKR